MKRGPIFDRRAEALKLAQTCSEILVESLTAEVVARRYEIEVAIKMIDDRRISHPRLR